MRKMPKLRGPGVYGDMAMQSPMGGGEENADGLLRELIVSAL